MHPPYATPFEEAWFQVWVVLPHNVKQWVAWVWMSYAAAERLSLALNTKATAPLEWLVYDEKGNSVLVVGA